MQSPVNSSTEIFFIPLIFSRREKKTEYILAAKRKCTPYFRGSSSPLEPFHVYTTEIRICSFFTRKNEKKSHWRTQPNCWYAADWANDFRGFSTFRSQTANQGGQFVCYFWKYQTNSYLFKKQVIYVRNVFKAAIQWFISKNIPLLVVEILMNGPLTKIDHLSTSKSKTSSFADSEPWNLTLRTVLFFQTLYSQLDDRLSWMQLNSEGSGSFMGVRYTEVHKQGLFCTFIFFCWCFLFSVIVSKMRFLLFWLCSEQSPPG